MNKKVVVINDVPIIVTICPPSRRMVASKITKPRYTKYGTSGALHMYKEKYE